MRCLRILIVALSLLVVVRPAVGDETIIHDRWYVMEMMGERAGWMHASVVDTGEHIRSNSKMLMRFNRAGVEAEVALETIFLETRDGEPIWTESTMAFGGQPTTTRYEFLPDGVRQTTEARGQKTETMLQPIEGAWLTPHETRQFLTSRIASGAESFSVRTLDPSVGIEPVTITYSQVKEVRIELMGRTVQAYECLTTNSATPGLTTREFIDAHGDSLRSELDMGGMKLTTIAADRELALSELVAPEMMVSTLIRPDRAIPGARTLKRATYLLRLPDGELAEPPTTGSQSVERVDGQTVRVRVTAEEFAPAGDVDAAAYLARSTMLDIGDETIIELRDRALEGVGDDELARAEALRRFVHRYIRKKSLGVGFASASEVARSCEGDCSEHGTLLAALLRADGIPARVASGLVYVDEFAGEKGVFGYHMWTQALLEIDGALRWVDLDATLPGTLDYDATHIALGLSALSDGETINSLVHLAPLIGRLQIEVERLD